MSNFIKVAYGVEVDVELTQNDNEEVVKFKDYRAEKKVGVGRKRHLVEVGRGKGAKALPGKKEQQL